MPQIRGNPSEKWVRRASVATEDYAQGIQSPRRPWATTTAAAASSYVQGVQQAIGQGRWQRGVQQAGDQRWSAKSLSKGAQRFGPGVSDAVNDYTQGVAPYFQVIESIQLPPRGPKGDPRNIERVAIIARALRARKIGTSATIGQR